MLLFVHRDSIIITSPYCSMSMQIGTDTQCYTIQFTGFFSQPTIWFSLIRTQSGKYVTILQLGSIKSDMRQKCNDYASNLGAIKQRQFTTMLKQLALRHTTQLFIQLPRLFKPVITFTSHLKIGTTSAGLTDWLHRYYSTEYIKIQTITT